MYTLNKLPNNKQVISFTVRWGDYGSTSWTVTCSLINGVPTIKALWNLARSNSQYDWDHILTGADTSIPKN